MNKPVPVSNIGTYVPMIDGPEKVSGRAKYTADVVGVNQLAGCIYRSPYAHGEIVDVDVSEALKIPGVVAIVTGADCDKTFGVLPIARSEHPLARDKVRYRGEPVAAVAAVDDVAARKAIRLIKMTVKELPAHFTAKDALARGATLLHEKKPGNIERDVRSNSARPRKDSPMPTSCAKAPITAPKSARTRWKCTPLSPNTTPCATA